MIVKNILVASVWNCQLLIGVRQAGWLVLRRTLHDMN